MITRYSLLILVSGCFAYSQIDAAAGHMVEALPPRDIGKEVYEKHCIVCHKESRDGIKNARLDSELLRKYKISDLIKRLQEGCSGNPNSPYSNLEMYELVKVLRHITKDRGR